MASTVETNWSEYKRNFRDNSWGLLDAAPQLRHSRITTAVWLSVANQIDRVSFLDEN